MTKLSEADRAKEIDSTEDVLAQITGAKPLLFRPPLWRAKSGSL
jgi:peptidoglycan/xylan/chitin deacetylase (PgdA/CDA1 family)